MDRNRNFVAFVKILIASMKNDSKFSNNIIPVIGITFILIEILLQLENIIKITD